MTTDRDRPGTLLIVGEEAGHFDAVAAGEDRHVVLAAEALDDRVDLEEVAVHVIEGRS